MRLCWLLAVVLGCGSSRAAPPPSSGAPDDCSRSVLVPCPNVTDDILRFSLFKDQQLICSHACDVEQDARRCQTQCSRSDVKPRKSEEGNLAGFLVVASKSSAVYQCEATVTFPPPLKRIQSDPVVLVLVEGHQCGRTPSGPPGDEDDPGWRLWSWIVAVALLSIYSLTVTILAGVSWVKLRRTDSHNDYMNTKPRVQRAPKKKKKGIQNPLPRHF